jgi:hypothetical protein
MGKENHPNIPLGNRDAPFMDGGDLAPDTTSPRQHKTNGDAEKDANLLGKEATVDVASERSLTFGSMLKGNAASKLTVFERKAALINA